MKKAVSIILACILICTVSVGCRGKRNPDGLSNKEAYDLAVERLTDELRSEFEEMFQYIINKYPGYRLYKYSPGNDRPFENPELSDTVYVNPNSFDEEELAHILNLMNELGALSFGIDMNPNPDPNVKKSVQIFFAEGEYEYEQANLWYYFDGDQGRSAASDLGDGWYYSYWIRQ